MVKEEDEIFMRAALDLAQKAEREDEAPVGCVVVREGRIIGQGRNMRERLQDPTAHAEIIALREASESINSWRLTGCSVYATLEPCVMCGGALVSARVGRLVFGADDAKAGACGSVLDVINHPRLNHRIDVDSGILGTECGNILTRFFQAQRSLGKK